MADSKPVTPIPELEYHQPIWGDLVCGTKDQIQALGIGIGLSFPGEVGCSRRRTLTVRDPRGFKAHIENGTWRGEGIFCVSVPLFEDHPRLRQKAQPYVPGVTKYEGTSYDEYCGSGEALAALGLVRLNQLPGQPGMRKMHVRILPDGSVLGGPPTANCAETRKPGAKKIERDGADTFRVRVNMSAEEEQQRWEREKIAEQEWERQIRALPRPAPLNQGRAAILARRAHLKLVWSGPERCQGSLPAPSA